MAYTGTLKSIVMSQIQTFCSDMLLIIILIKHCVNISTYSFAFLKRHSILVFIGYCLTPDIVDHLP